MNILIVTNLYPPHYLGGDEVHCAQVAEELQGAGYEVRVLTSTYGVQPTSVGTIRRRDDEVAGESVHRRLHEHYFDPQPVVQWAGPSSVAYSEGTLLRNSDHLILLCERHRDTLTAK